MDDKGESKIKNNSAYRYLLESSGSAENRRRDENGYKTPLSLCKENFLELIHRVRKTHPDCRHPDCV